MRLFFAKNPKWIKGKIQGVIRFFLNSVHSIEHRILSHTTVNVQFILYCIFFCLLTGSACIYVIETWKYYYNFTYLELSKRHNLFEDVRPKHIFGSKKQYLDWRQFDRIKGIPRIIHQTDQDEKIPFHHQKYMQSWLKHNPNWQHWYWTDKEIRNFIEIRFPDFLYFFDRYGANIQRADVFRYFVLYEFGGVYADCDIECLKPLDVKSAENDCILSFEPPEHALLIHNLPQLISNAYMACHPRHWFYKYVIDSLPRNNERRISSSPILLSTGPLMLDRTYNILKDSGLSNLPYVADYKVYQPKFDPRRVAVFALECKTRKTYNPDRYIATNLAEICDALTSKLFVNGPANNSYTIHHWSHKWDKYLHDKFGVLDDNRTLISDILT